MTREEAEDPLLERLQDIELATLTLAAAVLLGDHRTAIAAVDDAMRLRWRLKELLERAR